MKLQLQFISRPGSQSVPWSKVRARVVYIEGRTDPDATTNQPVWVKVGHSNFLPTGLGGNLPNLQGNPWLDLRKGLPFWRKARFLHGESKETRTRRFFLSPGRLEPYRYCLTEWISFGTGTRFKRTCFGSTVFFFSPFLGVEWPRL